MKKEELLFWGNTCLLAFLSAALLAVWPAVGAIAAVLSICAVFSHFKMIRLGKKESERKLEDA